MVVKSLSARRCYEMLLGICPPEFRGRYDDELICVFEESWRDAAAVASVGTTLMFWLRTIHDVIRTAIATRLCKLSRVVDSDRRISLAASLVMHAVVFWALTWLAYHPLPPPGPNCEANMGQGPAAKTMIAQKGDTGR